MDHLVNEWPTSRTSLYLSAISHRLSTISDTEPIRTSTSSSLLSDDENPFHQFQHSPSIKSIIENHSNSNTLEENQKGITHASTSTRAATGSRSPLLRLDVSITNDSARQLNQQCDDVKPPPQQSSLDNELMENSLSTLLPQGLQRCDQQPDQYDNGFQRSANLRNKSYSHQERTQFNKNNHSMLTSSSSSSVPRWSFYRLRQNEPIEATEMRKVISVTQQPDCNNKGEELEMIVDDGCDGLCKGSLPTTCSCEPPFVSSSTLQSHYLNGHDNNHGDDELLSLSLSLSSINSNCHHHHEATNKEVEEGCCIDVKSYDDEDVVLQHSAWQQPRSRCYANRRGMRVVPPSFERSRIDGAGFHRLLERIQTAKTKADALALKFSLNRMNNNVSRQV